MHLVFGQTSGLWEVVAERCPDHVLDALAVVVSGTCDRSTGPSFTNGIAVLQALAESALWSLVEVIPVAEGGFLNVAGVEAATTGGVVAGGSALIAARCFCCAGGGAGQFGAVALSCGLGSYRPGVGGCVVSGYGGKSHVSCTSRVVAAVVGIDGDAGGWVELKREQPGEVVNRRKLAARIRCDVRERGVSVAAYTWAVHGLSSEVDLLGDRDSSAAAKSAKSDLVVVVAGYAGFGNRANRTA